MDKNMVKHGLKLSAQIGKKVIFEGVFAVMGIAITAALKQVMMGNTTGLGIAELLELDVDDSEEDSK